MYLYFKNKAISFWRHAVSHCFSCASKAAAICSQSVICRLVIGCCSIKKHVCLTHDWLLQESDTTTAYVNRMHHILCILEHKRPWGELLCFCYWLGCSPVDKVSDLTKAFNTDHFPEISICNYINWDLLNLSFMSYLIFKIILSWNWLGM